MVELSMENTTPQQSVQLDFSVPQTQTFNLCSWRGKYQAKRIRHRRNLIYLCILTATGAALPDVLKDYQQAVIIHQQQSAIERALDSTQQVQQRSVLKPLQQQWDIFMEQRDGSRSQIQRSLDLQQPLLSPVRKTLAYQSLELNNDKAVLKGNAKHEADIIWLTTALQTQNSVKQVVVNNIQYQDQHQLFTIAVHFYSSPQQQPNAGE